MKGETGILLLWLIPLLGALPCRMLFEAEERNGKKTAGQLARALVSGLCFAVLAIATVLSVKAFRTNDVTLLIPEICGRGLSFRMDGFRAVYALITCFAWTVSSVFAIWYLDEEEHIGRYFFYTFITLGATLGVFLSAELYTTFVFFEAMSLASYLWVVHEEHKEAIRASKTYLAVAVIGGLVMLMGLFILETKAGTLDIKALPSAVREITDKRALYAAGFCMLFGFGAKAGAFPLHIWLPKAHPVAPAPASALLSGILTKAGMFGVLILAGRMFVSDERFGNLLFVIAVCTMLVGAVIALFSIDMKHILACSSVSQIGFMLTGAAAMCVLKEEQWIAVQGTLLHMVNHSAFKLVLFLLAGIAVRRLHSRDLNVLRGFGAGRYWLLVVFLSAGLGITGIPGFSGFVSKSMLHEAVVLCAHQTGSGFYKPVEWLFLLAGGCTVAYMLKLFIILFFKKPSPEVQRFNETKQRLLPVPLAVLISVPALLIYAAGTLPEYLMLPMARRASSIVYYSGSVEVFRTFSAENVKGTVISVLIGVVLWLFVEKKLITKYASRKDEQYVNRFPAWLSIEDKVYRPLLLTVLPAVFGGICSAFERITEGIAKAVFAVTGMVPRLMERVTEGIAKAAFGFAGLVAGLFDRILELGTTGVRRTVLKPVCETVPVPLSGRIAQFAGGIANGFANVTDRLFRKKEPHPDYRKSVNRFLDDMSETVKLISRSLSYGLLAFCAGLLAMLLYLLYCL